MRAAAATGATSNGPCPRQRIRPPSGGAPDAAAWRHRDAGAKTVAHCRIVFDKLYRNKESLSRTPDGILRYERPALASSSAVPTVPSVVAADEALARSPALAACQPCARSAVAPGRERVNAGAGTIE